MKLLTFTSVTEVVINPLHIVAIEPPREMSKTRVFLVSGPSFDIVETFEDAVRKWQEAMDELRPEAIYR